MIKISPSILAADFSKLGEEIATVESKSDYLHIDVMDGQFVPNISFGFPVMESLLRVTEVPFDVHLMIDRPDQYIDEFIQRGAQIITVHYEACTHLHRTLTYIQSKGVKAGVAINPGTPVSVLEGILPLVDLVLVMTVNPGFGGQKFIDEAVGKIRQLDEQKSKNHYDYEIQVDGGVNEETAKVCIDAGATILVAGSAIFKENNREEAILKIIQNANSKGS